jgi:hypothetical protein
VAVGASEVFTTTFILLLVSNDYKQRMRSPTPDIGTDTPKSITGTATPLPLAVSCYHLATRR